MRNAKPTQLTTCITLTNSEFEDVVKSIWGDKFTADYCGDRVGVSSLKRDIPQKEVLEKLRDYFDVCEVTSVFFNSREARCVWVVYTR